MVAHILNYTELHGAESFLRRRKISGLHSGEDSSRGNRIPTKVSEDHAASIFTTQMTSNWIFLVKLRVNQLVKNLFAFYGTRRFITVFIKNPPLYPVLNQMHTSYFYLMEMT
jgi:hypothetical protein